MEPEVVFACNSADSLNRIEGSRGGCSDGGDNGTGNETLGKLRANRFFQGSRLHRVVFIHSDEMQIDASKPGEQCGFLHRAVALLGNVNNQWMFLRLQAAIC